MFGKGRPKTAKVIEESEEEEQEEQEEETIEQQKVKSLKPVQSQVGKARIVEIQALEGNLFKFILIANKSFGNIGEEFEI